MKIYAFILLHLVTSALFARENASQVLDKYFKAIGGQSHIARVQNIYSFANCIGPNGAYQTEIYSDNGSKTIFRQIRENQPDYIGIANGETYWTKGQDLAVTDKNTAFAWRSHELQWIATHLTERFSALELVGHEDFAGKQAIKLSGMDELNKTAYLFFDTNTYLLLGFSLLSPFSEKPETIQLTIKEWKKTGKLLLPSKVTFTDQQGEFDLNFHIIKINNIKEEVFEIPRQVIEIKNLLTLHDLQRTAHFNRDARLLVSLMSDDFVEIRNGKINTPKKEDLIQRFQAYFDAVTFIEWDDIRPPVVQVSDDATVAYMFVNKRVRLKQQDNTEETTIFAWVSTFLKINDRWLMTSITSSVDE